MIGVKETQNTHNTEVSVQECLQERKWAKEQIAEVKREAAKELMSTRAAADQRLEESSLAFGTQVVT